LGISLHRYPALVAALLALGAPAAAQAQASPAARLSQAFVARAPGESLEARVARARREASRMGLWSAEAVGAGALLGTSDAPAEARARAAVRLAPGWPAGWGALAAARGGPEALAAWLRGTRELERHLVASVWWRATALHVLAWSLVAGGILFLVVSALVRAPVAMVDLARRLPGDLPTHALAAGLAAVVALPVAAGEGLLGLAAGALLAALPWAERGHRRTLALAALAVWTGIHPATDAAGRWLAALGADPVALAVADAETGRLTAEGRERLARHASSEDPAAAHALVLWSKRAGRLDEAQDWLAKLEVEASQDPILLNDAANVHLAAGDVTAAIDLYQRAAAAAPRAEIHFNLAQVHGSRIELAAQERALGVAQSLDPARVGELSELRGAGHLAVDLAWPVADLRGRMLRAASDGLAVAAALRRDFAVGPLGRDARHGAGLLAAALLLAAGIGRGRDRSGGRAAAVTPAWLAPALRTARLVVPGAAGVAQGRPVLGLLACLAAAAALASWQWRGGVAVDPAAAGAAGRAAFTLAGLVALAGWAGATAASRRETW